MLSRCRRTRYAWSSRTMPKPANPAAAPSPISGLSASDQGTRMESVAASAQTKTVYSSTAGRRKTSTLPLELAILLLDARRGHQYGVVLDVQPPRNIIAGCRRECETGCQTSQSVQGFTRIDMDDEADSTELAQSFHVLLQPGTRSSVI